MSSLADYPMPYDSLRKWADAIPNQVYLRQPIDGQYVEKTWAQVHEEVLRLAAGLRALGLKPGDVVAILGKNTAEWFITDYAISAAGLISAPIYFTAGEETIRYVLQHSEAKAIVVGKLDDLGPAQAAIPDGVITIAQPYETIPCDHAMEALIASHEPLAEVATPNLSDTFSYIYTSGSTGDPKGVILSYRNIGYGSTVAVRNLAFDQTDRLLSYLPLAHITERSIIQYVSLHHGCTVTFVDTLETFADDLRNGAPSMFISVPRLWMKFQSGILAKIPPKKLDRLLRVPLLRGVVRKKIKKQLGLSKARLCGSGAAPISPAVLDWYQRIGINISEGFGMSETSGLAMSHYPFVKAKLGTVGRPTEGVEVRLSDEGEILIRGDGVVQGYFKDPEKTAETFKDGWLHTGDKGEIDADGYVRITGRVKEIFKSGKGKYIVPVPIESLLQENPYIEQVCVMGSGLPQPMAVAVLAPAGGHQLTKQQIGESLGETLANTNGRLEAHQKLSHIVIAREDWTIENGLLTPTMKTKRNELEKKYTHLLHKPATGDIVFE